MGAMLNTMVNGSPGSCDDAVHWLDGLSRGGHDSARSADAARGHAESDWQGPASQAYVDTTARIPRLVDALGDTARDYSRAIADFSHALTQVQNIMKDALGHAIGGGLEMDGPFIVAPEPPGPAPGSPKEVCTPSNVHQQIGKWEGDAAAHQAQAADYNRKIAVYNECKGKVEHARAAESNAHDALTRALTPPPDSPGINAYAIGTASLQRTLGYINNFENPRKEAQVKAAQATDEAKFYTKWADGLAGELDDWQLTHLREKAAKAGAYADQQLAKVEQWNRGIKHVPQSVREAASAYPGKRALNAAELSGVGNFGRSVLRGAPYGAGILTVAIEANDAYQGKQSPEKAVVDSGALIGGGTAGAALSTAGAGAVWGAPLGPWGSLIIGTGGAIVGAIGAQFAADQVVPR